MLGCDRDTDGQHEGIYYFFRHELDKHILVFADSISAHDPAPGFEELHFGRLASEERRDVGVCYEWSTTKQVLAGAVTLKDYDFKKSRAPLSVDRSDPKPHDHADAKIYEYPG